MTVKTTNGPMIRALLSALFLLQNAHARPLDPMRFSVQVTSPVLLVSQNLETRLRITNRSHAPMYVYKDLRYLVSVFARTGSGKNLNKEFIDEVWPPPPERSSFILLKPGEHIEYLRQDKLSDLGVHKAGQYRIDFTYGANFPPALTYGLHVWSGRQQQSVVIRIVDQQVSKTNQ